jgi:nucleoside-diphosphate-sugar epimerase
MADKTMTKILVFGGNGFLGGETVVEILALNTFDITVINRGNWKNYDSNIRIRPFVKTINIDRCEYMNYDLVK